MKNIIQVYGGLTSEIFENHENYKETTITWMNPNCQVLSNNDIPIDGDIAMALDMIPELIRQARVDRCVEECAKWMRRKRKKNRLNCRSSNRR